MARNGSGTFNRIYNWVTDRNNGVKIDATRMDAEMDGMATGLSESIARDGQTTITANLPMAGFRHTGVGNASARTDYAATGQVQDGSFIYVGTVGGTADAITLTPSPAITAYAAGQTFRFVSSGANTTAATVAVSGLAAKSITKRGSTALTSGDIPSGAVVDITYDGTRFQMKSLVAVKPVLEGGTGQSSYTNGQLLIGNTTGNTLTKATLTAGSGISVTNGTGSITVATSNVPVGNITGLGALATLSTVSQATIDDNSVGYGELKKATQQTSNGSIAAGAYSTFTFTGGVYTLGWAIASRVTTLGAQELPLYTNGDVNYVTKINVKNDTAGNMDAYFQAAYIQASPPYDLGDGEIPLFIFVEVDSLGNIIKTDAAEDPPWAYNGPTKTRPDFKRNGKKFKRVHGLVAEFGSLKAARAVLSAQEFVRRIHNDAVVEVEITQAMKHADMPLIPHPFECNPGNTVVLLDPVCDVVAKLVTFHGNTAQGETISDLLRDGYLQIGNTPLSRGCSPGVTPVSVRWR